MLDKTEGLYVVAQTPFDDAGEIDLASMETLSDFYFRHGASGLTVLGVSGEAGRLSPGESVHVAERFVRASPADTVIVGVSNASVAQLVEFTGEVMRRGAAGVMIAPAGGLRTEEEVLGYFDAIFAGIGDVPTVLQDFPGASGVSMSVATICRLLERHSQITVIKHEDFPGLGKLSKLKAALDGRCAILTGSNALYLPLELGRGADGPMAGFSFPEVLSGTYRLHKQGEVKAMLDLYDPYLPLMRYEAQWLFGIAVRKEVMRRRGALRSARMRAPAPTLGAVDMAEIDQLLDRLDVRF